MALSIPLSSRAYSSQTVSINNTLIKMVFKFNHINNSWYIDILNSANEMIKAGIRVISNQNLTVRYALLGLPDGDLWCIKNNSSLEELGRDNFGANKDYGLYWVTDTEMELEGVDGYVQF